MAPRNPVLIKTHGLSSLVLDAVKEAEQMYPGQTFQAEVELNELLDVVIYVYESTPGLDN